MTDMNHIPSNNTVWDGDRSNGFIYLHKTKIAEWTPDKITLNHGGYMTKTTKDRLNQVSNVLGLGFKVHQSKGDWFVTTKDEETMWEGRQFEILRR